EHNHLCVKQNRIDHLQDGSRGGKVGAASTEQLHDLGTSIACALHYLFNTISRKQLRNRDACNSTEARERDHRVTMSSQDVGLHIANRDSQFLCDKSTETGRIEDARHTNDTLSGKATDVEGKLGHSVERIGDHNDDAV